MSGKSGFGNKNVHKFAHFVIIFALKSYCWVILNLQTLVNQFKIFGRLKSTLPTYCISTFNYSIPLSSTKLIIHFSIFRVGVVFSFAQAVLNKSQSSSLIMILVFLVLFLVKSIILSVLLFIIPLKSYIYNDFSTVY